MLVQKISLISFLILIIGCQNEPKKDFEMEHLSITKETLFYPEDELFLDKNLVKITDDEKIEELKQLIFQQQLKEKENLFKNKTLAQRYKLGDTTAIEALIGSLLHGEDELIKKTLKELINPYNTTEDFFVKEEKLQKTILELIEKDHSSFLAIQLAGVLKIKGYKQIFEQKILNNTTNAGQCFFWLSRNGYFRDTIFNKITDLSLNKINTSKDEKNKIYWGLKELSKHKSYETQSKVGDLALVIFEKNKLMEIFIRDSSSSKDYKAAECIAYTVFRYNSKKCVPILNTILKEELFEAKALEALVKINGKDELNRVNKYLNDSGKFNLTLKAAEILHDSLYSSSNVPKIVLSALNHIQINDLSIIDNVVEFLIQTNQEIWFSKLDSIITSKDLVKDLLYTYQMAKKDPADIAAALYHMGLADKEYTVSEINAAKTSDTYFGPQAYKFNMLYQSGIFIDLDSAVGINTLVPTLEYIYQNSNGYFNNPITGITTSHQEGSILTIIHKNNAYQYFINKNNISQREIIKLINTILKDNKNKSQFHQIGNHLEKFQYLFGEKEKVTTFQKDFLTPQPNEYGL